MTGDLSSVSVLLVYHLVMDLLAWNRAARGGWVVRLRREVFVIVPMNFQSLPQLP